jgi:hypothetical protein
MAGPACCCGYGRRQIGGTVPDRRPVSSGGVSTRHGAAVTVDIGTGARGAVIRRYQPAGLRQGAPAEVGGTVHVGCTVQSNRTVAACTDKCSGKTIRCRQVRSMGTDFGIRVGGNFRYCRRVKRRCGSSGVALVALDRGVGEPIDRGCACGTPDNGTRTMARSC